MPTFGHHVGGAREKYNFELFMEICGEGEEFYPYNEGGLNLNVIIIDLPQATVREPVRMRGEQTWTVQYLKTEIAKVSFYAHVNMSSDQLAGYKSLEVCTEREDYESCLGIWKTPH